MAPASTLVSKLKVQLRLAIQRLRMLQAKSTAIAKQQRRAMAELLAAGKLESARIRVEGIIRSDIGTELHEILELYCELVLARVGLLEGTVVARLRRGEAAEEGDAARDTKDSKDTKTAPAVLDDPSNPPPLDAGLDEAIRSIVFCAPRTDIKELILSRALLVDKLGKEYALEAGEGIAVPARVLSRVRVETPREGLVDAYLREIGRTYGVAWPGGEEEDEDGEEEGDADDDDDDGDGGNAEGIQTSTTPPAGTAQPSSPSPALPPVAATPLTHSPAPVRIAPPSPSTENPGPKIRGVGKAAAVGKKKTSTAAVKTPTAATVTTPASKSAVAAAKKKDEGPGGPGGKIPDVDELSKRFAALKRG